MSDRIRIAPLTELPDGRGVRVEAAGHRVAVFRLDDRVYAIGDRCSHAEASLAEGEIVDGRVECPRHGAAFDLETGEAATFPATRPVETHAVSIEDGDVYVTVETEEVAS